MGNKIFGTILGLLSILLFYLTYNQFRGISTTIDIYQVTDNPIPSVLYFSILVPLVPAIICLVFSLKLLVKNK